MGPGLIYAKGKNNTLSGDALSWLDIIGDDDNDVALDESAFNIQYMEENLGINEDYLENINHLCTFKRLLLHQQKDNGLLKENSRKNINILLTPFLGRRKLVSQYVTTIKW